MFVELMAAQDYQDQRSKEVAATVERGQLNRQTAGGTQTQTRPRVWLALAAWRRRRAVRNQAPVAAQEASS
jgi:hypothetical protein